VTDDLTSEAEIEAMAWPTCTKRIAAAVAATGAGA